MRRLMAALALLLLLGGVATALGNRGVNDLQISTAAALAADQDAGCTITVSPGQSISNAIGNAASGAVVCLRNGVYSEFVRVSATRPGVTIQSYPGEWAVLDGQRRIPDNDMAPLIRIEANNTILQNMEIRNSAGRGVAVEYPGQNVILRNLKIHDNWQGGIVIKGNSIFDRSSDGIENYVKGARIENSEIYENIRKARNGLVVLRGTRTGTSATAWNFDTSATWDSPFFKTTGMDMPDKIPNGVGIVFNGGSAQTIFISAGNNKSRFIGGGSTRSGSEIAYESRDVLRYDPSAGKWGLALDGGQFGMATSVVIDAIEAEPQAGCGGCYPLLLSFSKAFTLNGVGAVGPADIVRFMPNGINGAGQYTGGSFSMYKRATDIGLLSTANIDALGRWPDGRLVISLAGTYQSGGQTVSRPEDLLLYNEAGRNWVLFFDSSAIPLNPFPTDGTSVSFDGSGNIYTSGNVVGGSAVAFIEAQGGGAFGNKIYRNYGEGLVSGRGSDSVTFQGNTIWDSNHANVYLNVTTNPKVTRNLVYCGDDRRYWSKQAQKGWSAGPGISIRDESFGGQSAAVSSGQIIVNNIVVGCSPNFTVDSQVANGGLRDATVANNTFINGHGDSNGSINNVLFIGNATVYYNSSFRNNLILQDTSGNMVRNQGTLKVSNFQVSNNLYSKSPPTSWFAGEPGRVIGRPLMANPQLIGSNTTPDPAWFALIDGSPAINRAMSLPIVQDDYFGQARGGTPDIGADEK